MPPPGAQHHAPYNPQIHAQLNAGQQITIPPPPSEQLVGATYIPSGDTFGEGVGIPAFGPDDYTMPPVSQPSWSSLTPPSTTDTNVTTPLDDLSIRDKFPTGTTATSTPSTTIAPEIIAQWPLDTVLIWLAKNQFSREWQETFKALDISGSQFLEMGVKKGSHKTSQMIHLHVYPRLKEECLASGTHFDQVKEREEVKRMRRLINNILTGKTLDPSKMPAPQGRKGSMTNGNGHGLTSLPSAGTDPSESPSVSIFLGALVERHPAVSVADTLYRHPSTLLVQDLAIRDPLISQQTIPAIASPSSILRLIATAGEVPTVSTMAFHSATEQPTWKAPMVVLPGSSLLLSIRQDPPQRRRTQRGSPIDHVTARIRQLLTQLIMVPGCPLMLRA